MKILKDLINIATEAIRKAEEESKKQSAGASQPSAGTSKPQQNADTIANQRQRLQNTLSQLREQLRQKEKLLKEYQDCYNELIKSRDELTRTIEQVLSQAQAKLRSEDRVKVLNRSYEIVKTRLGSPKVTSIFDEMEEEKRTLIIKTQDLEEDILWLKEEISRKERELWNLLG